MASIKRSNLTRHDIQIEEERINRLKRGTLITKYEAIEETETDREPIAHLFSSRIGGMELLTLKAIKSGKKNYKLPWPRLERGSLTFEVVEG